SFNKQDLVLAVSADVAFSIYTHIKSEVKVEVLHNGVNTHFFSREEEEGRRMRKALQIPEDAVVVGLVAVFRPQKRIPEWIRVFAELAAQHQNLYATIVGDGPMKNDIMEAIQQSAQQEKICLVGLQENTKPYYAAMDIFMMSSEFEGLPVAMLEAMSMQCAIVTTDAGGIKELIEDKENGLMLAVDNLPGLGAQLKYLASDADIRKQLASAARKTVEEKFSLQKMVGELEVLYGKTANV
ncbi:MAG TPA: glycosyltransferase, partial [Cyclobacteriaceae bacterium]|nr:glycosyltransferase [Cyclobacteriaceae bacterium]